MKDKMKIDKKTKIIIGLIGLIVLAGIWFAITSINESIEDRLEEAYDIGFNNATEIVINFIGFNTYNNCQTLPFVYNNLSFDIGNRDARCLNVTK